MMVKRIMRALHLGKIAAVDRPCQEGALAVITKRADDSLYETLSKRTFTAEERRHAEASGAAMSGGRYPIENKADLENAIHAVGRGKGSHAAIRAHIMRRAKALGAENLIPDSWHVKKADVARYTPRLIAKTLPALSPASITALSAEIAKDAIDGDEAEATLFDDVHDDTEAREFADAMMDEFCEAFSDLRESVCSILCDDDCDDKQAMLEETFAQFKAHIPGVVPEELEKALAAGIAALAGSAGTTSQGESMDAIKKALGLPATASEADIVKAVENEKKKREEAEKAEKLAKMSEKHKKYMEHPEATMPEGGKERFRDMEPGERDKHIEAHPLSEENEEELDKMIKRGLAFRTPEGVIVTKRSAAANFEVFKSLNDRAVSQAAIIAKQTEEAAVADFAKRAVSLGFPEAFGAVLRKAYGGDAASISKVENEFLALRKQVETGALFSRMGSSSAQTGTAYAELVAKAEELRKSRPELTSEQAFEKVYTDRANGDIVKRYKSESRAH